VVNGFFGNTHARLLSEKVKKLSKLIADPSHTCDASLFQNLAHACPNFLQRVFQQTCKVMDFETPPVVHQISLRLEACVETLATQPSDNPNSKSDFIYEHRKDRD
jgi:hypothetical protein